jgi:hypothetical protein
MPNTNPTIVSASLSDKELQDSINKMVANFDKGLQTMLDHTNKKVEEIQQSLQKIGNTNFGATGSNDGGISKRTKAQSAETVAVKESTQAYKEKTLTLDQQSTAANTAIRSEKKYTDEILKQAAAIRSMPEWKQGKDIRVSTPSGYDAVVNSHKKLSLEEQLLKVYMMEDDSLGQLVRLEQSSELKSKEKLGTEKQITEEIKKQQKAYESPFMYNQVVNKGSLRGLAMDKLGLDKGAIVTSDATSSLKNVNAELNQLQETYQRMTAFERNSPWGKVLRQRMQEVQRQSQQLNAQLSRPVDLKSALGNPEKTLDDIAYKMRQLASYRTGLNVETQRGEIGLINAEYDRLKKKMDEVMQKNSKMQ